MLLLQIFHMADEAGNAKEGFSWPGAEVGVIQFGNFSCKTVIVGICGNLTDRIEEAKKKGYIGITVSDRNYLFKLANYVENGRFNLQKACEETKLPRFQIRGLLNSYREIGIDFPEVSYSATPKTIYSPVPCEESAEPHTNFNRLVKNYKQGRSMEREAFEDLVDIVRAQDGEITDIKKRLELLEKK